MNDDLNGRQSRDWDEGKNATGRRFYPRSNENKELKDGAMLLRATTIFSEVGSEEVPRMRRSAPLPKRERTFLTQVTIFEQPLWLLFLVGDLGNTRTPCVRSERLGRR